MSSGATMPARAPASIDMLQTVSRSSMRHRADRRPGVLDDVADRAAGADLRDDREDHVLGADAVGRRAVDRDAHRLRRAPARASASRARASISRRADAERERAERAVRRRVAVAADQQQPGQRDALLGPDDVHDPLALVAEVERRHPCLPTLSANVSTMRRISGVGASAGERLRWARSGPAYRRTAAAGATARRAARGCRRRETSRRG